MNNSFQIANFFIKASQDEGCELSPMKLIKLAYISHGWSLGLKGVGVLDEAIYAWKYGPVINSIYHTFKEYGSGQITELYKDDNSYPMPDPADIEVLGAVWKSYKNFSAIQLSTMTHQPNTPWDIVWNQQGGCKKENAIIPNNIIQDYYKKKVEDVKSKNGNSVPH